MVESVTVSVNYADYLALSLAWNAQYFSRIVVVTDTKDELTPRVCEKYSSVECVRTDDFYTNNVPFAKSAGLNVGLRYLSPKGWIVALDADVVITKNLASVFKQLETLDPTCIYGPRSKYHVQKSEEGSNLHSDGTACAGFFQLFNGPYVRNRKIEYPNTSGDCSVDDILFSKLFRAVNYIDASALHIGPSMPDGIPNINWQGRKSEACPLSRGQIDSLVSFSARYG